MREIKAGKIEFRVDKTGNVHAPIGKVSFAARRSSQRTSQAFMDQIVRAKPAAAKGVYVRIVTVSSTMGPGVRLDTDAVPVTDEARPRRQQLGRELTEQLKGAHALYSPTSPA